MTLEVIMAHSVYISSNLTQQQLEFMKLLDDYEIELFQFDEIENQINRKFDNLNEVLENLVHKELISRIERGKFCKVNFRDENVIGTFVVKNSAIAYWSALNLHGLTEQFSNTIFIQTTHRKEDKTLLGTPYKFITINKAKRTGIIWNGYGNTKYPITDIEKTIVDCFDQPQYSGGYAELIRALSQVEINADKMINYCKSVNNTAVTKRIGFLTELFEKPLMEEFTDFAKAQVNGKYNLLDPQGTEKGEFVASWKLRLNISKDELLNLSDKQY
ncbi:type IV toxin-antitoxin system AbiEi family antitoxin domain-containing protein [Mucilaginibacter sp.]